MSEFFKMVDKVKAANLSPVTLAFLGDAVYSLFVREGLVLEKDCSAGVLQKLSCEKVSARGQNLLLEKIQPVLTEEELAVFKRGRNAKKPTRSKSASVAEYNNSTGLEAVFVYLYLTGQYDRLAYLFNEEK